MNCKTGWDLARPTRKVLDRKTTTTTTATTVRGRATGKEYSMQSIMSNPKSTSFAALELSLSQIEQVRMRIADAYGVMVMAVGYEKGENGGATKG